jgi:HEPN domain-containing protein
MRYPDAVHGQEIPEEVFDRQTAESVLSFAEQIIDIVEIRFIK